MTRSKPVPLLAFSILLVATAVIAPPQLAQAADGMASYYGGRFHGRRTASGQRFDQNAMTAAHRKLRFGTRVRVTNVRTGRSVVVTINDRGPYAHGRIIDLSRGAAGKLGMLNSGVAPVRLEVLGSGAATARKVSAKSSGTQPDTLWGLFGADPNRVQLRRP